MSSSRTVINVKSMMEGAPLPSTDSNSPAVGTAEQTLSNSGTPHLKLKAANGAYYSKQDLQHQQIPSLYLIPMEMKLMLHPSL